MSTIQADEIIVNNTQTNTILDSSGGQTVTVNGVTPNTNTIVGRSLLINGAMNVAQRGTSVTGWSTDEYSTLDRWRTRVNGLGTWDISQDSDSPAGFSYSTKWVCATADPTPAAGDYIIHEQRIEGQNLQHLQYGTSNAKSLTASFWVKSNKTGLFHVGLYSNDNSGRHINSSYSITSTDTWEYKTVTFEGDTAATLDNDNGDSLRLWFFLDSGSEFHSGTQLTTWGPHIQADVLPDDDVNRVKLGDTLGNSWQITGVKLEVGEIATEFDHRSYAEELTLCQRYLQRTFGGSFYLSKLPIAYSSAYLTGSIELPVPMRSTPVPLNLSSGSSIFSFTSYDSNFITSSDYNIRVVPVGNSENKIRLLFHYGTSNNSGNTLPSNISLMQFPNSATIYSEAEL